MEGQEGPFLEPEHGAGKQKQTRRKKSRMVSGGGAQGCHRE